MDENGWTDYISVWVGWVCLKIYKHSHLFPKKISLDSLKENCANNIFTPSSFHNPIYRHVQHIPWKLGSIELVGAHEVTGSLVFLMGWGSECGCRLVTVGGGRRAGVVPLRRWRPILAALHQVGPLRKRRTPILLRATVKRKIYLLWQVLPRSYSSSMQISTRMLKY